MPVRFIITGFGPFGTVSHNPSGMLAHRFDASPEKKRGVEFTSNPHVKPKEGTQWYIDHCEEVDVNCDAVKKYWETRVEVEAQRMHKLGNNNTGHGEEETYTVFIHLGVGNRFSEINFETVARNQCVFAAPDTKGVLLVNKPVIEGEAEKLRCQLPIFELCQKFDDIQKSEGRELLSVPSMDAGGYLCNYMFYHSMNYTFNRDNYYSMFLHLPNLQTWNIDAQYTAIHSAFQLIADKLCPPPPELSVVPITRAVIETVGPLLENYRALSSGYPAPKEENVILDPNVRAHLEHIVRDNNDTTAFLIAHKAGKGAVDIPTSAIVGFVQMSAVSSALLLAKTYTVTDMFVAPGARRGGIGRALLQGGVAHARERGASRLSATIEDSESVRQLMEKEGWRHLAGQCSVILAL